MIIHYLSQQTAHSPTFLLHISTSTTLTTLATSTHTHTHTVLSDPIVTKSNQTTQGMYFYFMQ